MTDWKKGLTPEQIKDAEMQRGAEISMSKEGAAQELFASMYDPDYKPRLQSEYNRNLAERNKHRWGDKK